MSLRFMHAYKNSLYFHIAENGLGKVVQYSHKGGLPDAEEAQRLWQDVNEIERTFKNL